MVALTTLQLVGAFLLPLFAVAWSFGPFHRNPMGIGIGHKGLLIEHEYVRYDDVKRQCQSVLSSAAELNFNASRAAALLPELSFLMGDWKQDGAPLMPFDGTDEPEGGAASGPLPLATLTLTHVDVAPLLCGNGKTTALNVTGVLGVAISRNGTAPDMGPYVSPEFKVCPGSTEVKMLFEGVYTESDDGERVLCMVGEAVLPRRGSAGSRPWDWAKNTDHDNFEPPDTNDKNILLVIRYPTTLTLTTRAVRGELTSTNAKSDVAYFGAVTLLSQLGASSNYKFRSEEIVRSTACGPHPYLDADDTRRGMYRSGGSPCGILDMFTPADVFTVVPNWKCNSTDALCRRLGPFDVTDSGFKGVSIIMKDFRCQPSTPPGERSAKVSAVFRAVPPWQHPHSSSKRSGLGGMTLSAEGVWRASTGQLCMVGCLGVGKEACHSRLCLYVQTSFSATRRSVVVGQINRIAGVAYSPLTFKRTMQPSELWNPFGVLGGAPLAMAYNYTKTKQVRKFLTRNEPFNFGTAIAKTLMCYPQLPDNHGAVDLSSLADELTLHVPAVPDLFPSERFEQIFLQLEVLSLGSLVGRNYSGIPGAHSGHGKEGRPSSEAGTRTATATTAAETSLLNMSAQLTLSGDPYANLSTLYLEGVYNPVDGRMYLIGCRSIDAPNPVAMEDGMDCSIEVRVDYPPTAAKWLINPTAKVRIASTRDAGDPLRFNATSLQTLPIMYRQQQRQDILSRRSVERILRVATLAAAVPAEFTQLMYIKANTDVIPYVSLVMLGVQTLGYSVPLITGVVALFTRIAAAGVNAPTSYWITDCGVKILILAAFLVTLRLALEVVRSRIRMRTRSPLEPGRVPSDWKVFLYSFGPHLLGFTVVLAALRQWTVTLAEYVGLAQDLFLLPQVVGNLLWRIKCRPLKKSYYVTLTAVRLLPHLYGLAGAAPAINPYFAEDYEFVNTRQDLYSAFGGMAIPLLAAAAYVQQRWNYKIIIRTIKTQKKKLQHLGSKLYERLPSVQHLGSKVYEKLQSMSPAINTYFEALVAGVNEAAVGLGPRRDGNLAQSIISLVPLFCSRKQFTAPTCVSSSSS